MAVKQFIRATALAGAIAASAGVCSAATVRPLLLSGQPAPAGLTFASFGRAAINTRGTLCFLAGWDSLQHRPEGLFLRQAGQVLPIARAGDPIPGSTGRHFSFPPGNPDEFTSFSLNNQDQVAFIARQGLFFYSQGAIIPLAQVGDEVPGVPDERWDEIDSVSLNGSGAVAFVAVIRSTQDGTRQGGVFLSKGGGVQIVLFDGDSVPNLDGVLNGFGSVSLNDAGAMATLALEGDAELGCILFTSSAGTSAVAVEAQPAPGGEVWTELDSAALNNAGVIAFAGRAMSDTTDHAGIYRAAGGAVSAVALPGQAVAGGGALSDDLGRPALDDAGDVAFVAGLSGTPAHRALVLAAGGSIAALAVAGQPAPADGKGTITRFSGLNLGSAGPNGIVCGTATAGGTAADAILRYPPSGAPEVLISTAAPLPAGATLSLADDATPPHMVQARLNRSGDLVFAADVGGYGRALFQSRSDGPKLLTPLGASGSGYPNTRAVSAFDLNDAGQIAFLGVRDEADQDEAIVAASLDAATTAQLIAATGQALPGPPVGSVVSLGPPRVDAMGGVLFAAASTGTDGAGTQASLLRAASGHLDRLAAEGQTVSGAGKLSGAPDAGSGGQYSLFRELQLGPEGNVLFLSSYVDGPTGAFVPAGLFLLTGGVIRAVALPGQQSPLSQGAVYTGFTSPGLSRGGLATFAATVAGPRRKTSAGLFQASDSDKRTLFAKGDSVPGLDATQFTALSDPVVNAAGDLAFVGTIAPATATGSSTALFVTSGGVTRLALKDGNPVDTLTGATLRIDDSTPAAALSLGEDGSLLLAADLNGTPSSVGLFLVTP